MLYTLVVLCVIGLIIYIFFAFGLPKIVSLYASRKFKADVSIGTIDLFRRELRKIRLVHRKSQSRQVNLFIQSVKLTTNFFSETCSSLLTLKFHGIEAKVAKQNGDENQDEDQVEDKIHWLQKIVSALAFVKFLVTFSFENVHVYVEGDRFATISVSKADFYTETTRSGFLNLITEIESADVQGPQLAFGSTQNCKIIGIFCLHNQSPSIEHLEICSSNVKSNIPIQLLKKQNSSPRRQSSIIGPKLQLPNLSINIQEVEVSVSYEKISWSSNLTAVQMNHVKSEQKSDFKTDEIAISDDKGNVFIQQFKLNQSSKDGILATWSHISVQSCVESLDSINLVRMKYLDTYQQGSFKRRYMEDTTLTIEISGGTIQSTQSNLALHVQQVISKVGQFESSKAGNNFYLDNFHLDFDKEQNEVAGTIANVGMALCEDSLSIVFEWSSSVLSMTNQNQPSSSLKIEPPSKLSAIKWGIRSQSIQIDFTLENDLSCQLLIESSKSKGQGSLKGIGCKGLSLVIKEPLDSCDSVNSVIQVHDVSLTQDSSVKEVLIKFPNVVAITWSTLAHRVLFDISSIMKKLWLNSLLSMMTTSRRSKNKKAVATLRLVMQKGLELKAQLQKHALRIKLSSFDWRKVGDEWKFQIPDLTVDVIDECKKLIKFEALAVQKSMTNPLAHKFRLDIDGVMDKDNTSIVASMALLQFNFIHQMDVYDVLSNDLMAIVKWLRLVHGTRSNNFDIVHPDVLIFIRQLDIEFQDDPFEVCLRDNFELLEDEHFESLKRFECLENKIAELKKTHPMLQTSTIEELFSNLKKKNADIYVQRASKLRHTVTKRTRLLSFNLSSMEFFIFSDRSMTGYETAVDFIQEIDPDSPCSEDLEFISAFHKWVRFECKSASTYLRDYPQNLTDAKHILFWGKVAFAEEAPADRAIRKQVINQGRPYYDDFLIERSLLSFKLYHDLALDMDFASFAHGPCWEPTLSHFSIALSYLTGKAKDPSPPLAWWDKMRLLVHGRLLMSVKTLKLQMHTTLDPYNTTEEVELTFDEANFDWTNGQFKILAEELNLFVRTASKYDDCQLLHVPNVVLVIKLDWLCLGNPNDHHSIMPCAREKLPEYSHNVEHDSYRAFRSQNVNVHLNIETRKRASLARPRLEMFSSTIRWMESLKWLFSGASRPIRRGKIFSNFQPPRKSLFRHFKKFQLSLAFHQLQLDYWTSASMTKGVQVNVAKGVSLSSEYSLKLLPITDGLIHRPRSNWTIEYTNCQVGTSDIWFQSMTPVESKDDNENGSLEAGEDEAEEDKDRPQKRHIEKSFFFSVEDVQYNRDVSCPMVPFPNNLTSDQRSSAPTHILTVTGAKGAWTQSNRDMAFSLYDSWRRAHILRDQVSTEGLKNMMNFKKSENTGEKASSPTPPSSASSSGATGGTDTKPTGELSLSTFVACTSPKDPLSSSQRMVPIVYSEDNSSDTKKNEMEAMAACTKDDVLFRNWLIRFVNSQMLLKGCETQGHLILSAAKTEILSQIHMPVWKDQTLMSKSSWSGSLESMQYFATVIAQDSSEDHVREETILWLTKDQIEDNEKRFTEDDLPGLVGSGQSVGGVISEVVGPAEAGPQLQRIVSRCKCEFYYVAYGESSLEEVTDRIPKRPEVNPWSASDEDHFVNAFSLIHHDLDVCTNSLQYSMILDVLNNLLLYIEPSFRSRSENYMRMKYQLMLANVEDQRKPIVQLHTQIRQMVCQLRAKEKVIFAFQTDQVAEGSRPSISGNALLDRLEKEVQKLKEEINSKSEELDIRQRCLKEFQMMATEKQIRGGHVEQERQEQLRRKSEIFFSRAHWKLTETDGQLGIADAIITNFYYTKSVMRDDSVEHLFEIGYLNVKNCLPGQLYSEVIYPTELSKDVPLDRQRTLRVFCREKTPVGGISVKAHFEINLVPLTIGITQAFYKRIMAFCFPEKASSSSADHHLYGSDNDLMSSKDKKKLKAKGLTGSSGGAKPKASFYVESPLNKDDVEEMKVRAQQNKLFVYIKIPEVPICVSYKGEKEKNKILDVANFRLQVPTIEYHNMTWTWLDLLLAVKSRIKDSLLSQAIKQKLSLKHRVDVRAVGMATASGVSTSASSTSDIHSASNDNDEEKAKLLLGARHILVKGSSKK